MSQSRSTAPMPLLHILCARPSSQYTRHAPPQSRLPRRGVSAKIGEPEFGVDGKRTPTVQVLGVAAAGRGRPTPGPLPSLWRGAQSRVDTLHGSPEALVRPRTR